MLSSIVSPLDGFRSPFGPQRGFNPARLFGTTDTGWFYDLSDMSTLFQDAAGTTPAAIGLPVGLMLDKSGRGNHRSQSISLNRPTYARHPLGGIRNLLTFTEDFSNAAWSKLRGGTGVTPVVTNNAGLAPDGTNTAIRVVCDISSGSTSSDWSFIRQSATSIGVNRLRSFWIKSNTGLAQTIMYGYTGATSESVTTEWTFVERAEFSGLQNFDWGLVGGVTGQTLDVLIWHPQLENGSTATAYQRVGSVFDVTEAGQPDLYYLSYDGLNDSLSTSAFAWGTDKATVVAGVRKLSDAAGDRVIVEASANSDSTNGTFRLGTNAATFTWRSRGAVSANTSGAGAQPISAVLTGIGDISGDVARLRRTAVQVGEVLTDQGTGNFGTHPVFFGARDGTSAFFNGREYSQFAINRLLTANELSQIERYTAQRTGVTL